MTISPVQQIIEADPPAYRHHVDKVAQDRNALLAIKMGLEDAKRELKKQHGNRYPPQVQTWNQELTRRLEIVDTALRHLRARGNPVLARTGGAPAWIYSLVVSDDTGNDYFQMASMLNPPKFHARECRKAAHPEEIPVILQFLQQEDIEAIHPDLWDETCPTNLQSQNEQEAGAGNPATTRAS